MRIGQTSIVVFGAKLLTSVLGFAATLYFARILGAEVLGYYALVLVVTKWLRLVGDVGVSSAVKKRISEEEDPSAYFTAGLVAVVLFGVVAAVSIAVFRGLVNSYVGVDAARYVVLLVAVTLIASITTAGLEGKRLVHISGLLGPVRTGFRSLVQIALVILGFELAGMLLGYAAGSALVIVVGAAFLSVGITRPRREHFRSLFEYAKFSWLGSLRGRAFNDMDVVVLGALVSPNLVGVYSIAWSLTSFIGVFGSSIRQTMFPELSHADAEERTELFKTLVSDSLAFTGLIAIPGLFGAVVMGDRLLRIYGDEFTRGTAVLGLLILSMLVYDYQNQLLNALNALDRPDISFRINAAFLALNLVMNVGFVLLFGFVGAAIATALSVSISLLLALYYLHSLLSFEVPIGEIGRQFGAAVVMAAVVFTARRVGESVLPRVHNATLVVSLVAIGAGTYFLVLLAISGRFRTTVVNNSPVRIPFVS